MAVTGVLAADFSSFLDACDRATTKLVSIESGAGTVETSLSRMVDSFSGRRVIQEATLMGEAIERSGGVTRLTGSELERAGIKAAEAAEKMRALGMDVPPQIQALADASRNAEIEQSKLLDTVGLAGGRMAGLTAGVATTGGAVLGLTGTYRQFDGVLQAAGINIGPQVRAIEDLSRAAGQGAGTIGLLGSAGLVIGTGLAAWGITRAVMEFTGLDRAVERGWQSLMGYGDAAQVAGAKQDVINRAVAQGASGLITYTQAVEFNERAQQRLSDAHAVSSERLAAAQREVRALSEARIAEIEIAQRAGATEAEITRHFGLSSDALRVLADRQRLASESVAEHTRRSNELAEAKARETEQLERNYARLMSDVRNRTQLAIMEADAAAMLDRKRTAAEGWIAAQTRATAESRAAAEAESARIARNQAEIDAQAAGVQQLAQAHTDAGVAAAAGSQQATQGYGQMAQQITITGEGVRALIELQRFSMQANAINQGGSSLFQTQSQRDRLAELPIPRFDAGVTNFGGGLAKVHQDELLVNLPAGTDVIPAGRGGSGVVNNTFNLSGMVGDRQGLARTIEQILIDRSMGSGRRLAVGV